MESLPVKNSKDSKKGRVVPDLKNTEYVNAQLKRKLKVLTAEMKDAAERMNAITLEITVIRNENILFKDRVVQLEQENALLMSQIEEMASEQAERDAIIEEFGTAVEARIVEWKGILDEKDTMIAKLKENLLQTAYADDRLLVASPDERNRAEIERLIQDIDRRDEIITELQSKLSEAVVEINESTLLIEKFKSDGGSKEGSKRNSKDQREMNRKMQDVNKKINTLENLLERAERDAKVKSEQLCEALAILNKYEDENSSLTQAFSDIKALQEQIEKKNLHVADLLDIVNRLEIENSRYGEAIIVLRDQLGITENGESSVEDLLTQHQKAQDEKIIEMERNYNELSSENVDLKFKIRKLKVSLKEFLKNNHSNNNNNVSSDGENVEELSRRSESKKEHIELLRIKENVKTVIEENEALRQGMHEILDCIHRQDGKSIVTIQSQTLENLLDALDARNLAGWYHPAMRLQGRVKYLQGSNAELRAQLQQIRKNQLLMQEDVHQQRSNSVEEGECCQSQLSPGNLTFDDKGEIQATPTTRSSNLTPKSTKSSQSQNADSGRASGKAVDTDEIQQAGMSENDEPLESYRDTPLYDEGFGKKSEEVYALAKEMAAQKSDFRKALSESENRQKLLEGQIVALRKKFASFVSLEAHNELRERYLEASMRLRAAFEDRLVSANGGGGDDDRGAQAAWSRVVQELRTELVSVHKRLSELTTSFAASRNGAQERSADDLEGNLAELRAENERLRRCAEIAQEEALMHRAIDSTVLAEFSELRQRILKLEAEEGQGVKETARLSLDVANYKVIETELREQKKLLKQELIQLRQEVLEIRRKQESFRDASDLNDEKANDSEYIEIIDFLQHQYAGSTSLSAWQRYEDNMNKLRNDQNEVKELLIKINSENESLKMQHETLTSRLQIVEQLKDILKQQIGHNNFEDFMQRSTTETRQILSESKFKVRVNQLEEAMQKANSNLVNYESNIALMEREMIKVQKAWKVQKVTQLKNPACSNKAIETEGNEEEKSPTLKQSETKAVQAKVKICSTETQCTFPCNSIVHFPPSNKTAVEEIQKDEVQHIETENNIDDSDDEGEIRAANIALLQEQLGQALTLASERSIALTKCESQLAEFRAKNEVLSRLFDERLGEQEEARAEAEKIGETPQSVGGGGTSLEVLQSTIKSLQKMIAQKEDAIARYQSLLKEDRDKHSKAAGQLQEEIKCLRKQLTGRRSPTFVADGAPLVANTECPERDFSDGEALRSDGPAEDASILREKNLRLQTELRISTELAERWHRLAEDRLRHMDSTRERLEEQHREEIDSYRKEVINRQREIDEIRHEAAEHRRLPTTKSEVLNFMRALQIKDNRLADEIENELEGHMVVASQQLSTTYNVENSRIVDLEQSHCQMENVRRQLQASMERERTYKSEITELQQQLSRRYMAVKAQEKKASRREMQLERKVKELEEELHEAKEILDHHFVMQQAKRVKTAEDLGLWEKLKKWQQTAERLKEKLKEKSDECQRLQNNYEKLRSLISCMEREKWYLRGKHRSESASMSAWYTTREPLQNNDALVQDLQRECQELRCRISELVDRLNEPINEENEEKTRPVPISYEDEDCAISEVKRLREMHDILEKENLRLETSNFELRIELERAAVNIPRYQEKIQHLEKYIELLKSEKLSEPPNYSANPPRHDGTQRTKAELERTVMTLKGLVEKLQLENKRLRNTVLQCDLDVPCNCAYSQKEDVQQARLRIASLQAELQLAKKRIALLEEATVNKCGDNRFDELEMLRDQLSQKSELLLKVKDLLGKAALNEKALRQRIQQLEYKQTLSVIPECGTSLAILDI